MTEWVRPRGVFVTGIPGAGKTTLAGRIAKQDDRTFLSAHDIVELVDPAAIAEGRMADEQAMRTAFIALMGQCRDDQFVMDGWPRNAGQGAIIPPDCIVIHLRCDPAIATERLSRRGREDDTPDLIRRRLDEQAAVFDEPWIRDLADWHRTINTSKRTPGFLESTVMLYLTGKRREVF